MSSFKTSSSPARNDVDTDPTSRRKMSTDLSRLKNFPSALSLRKQDPDTSPHPDAIQSSGSFSRFRPFSSAQRPSRSSLGSDKDDNSTDVRSSRRASRLLDAFKPSKKPAPSFEVIRKPTNRSTTSFQSTVHHPSPDLELYDPARHPSAHATVDVPQPAPRISLSAPRSQNSLNAAASTAAASSPLTPNALTSRPPYPPSTAKTRKSSTTNSIIATNRRTSDPYLNLGSASNSRAHSPSPNPNTDITNGSFSLHSFRNVRSTSDVSTAEESGPQTHSRVQSMISVDEYVTPGEELPEPRFPDDSISAFNAHDAARAQSTSPAPSVKPASISAAKFRQASRHRSESGTVPTIDTIQAGSSFVRPPRSRTPSQDLAAMEAVLAQTHPNTFRTAEADRRKSTDLTQLTAAPSAFLPNTNTNEDSQRRKRGFFIVVEGLDRAGKSTQVERLAAHLQAKAIKFPERTTAIGQMINSYLAQTSDLDDQAIHLLFSANRWECVASLHRTLEAGESIVCDRYAFSGIAYSVAKGLSYDWCRNPDVGLPLPDLTLFLDLDANAAAARGGYGEERYEKLDFQAKVREAFTRVSQDVRTHGGRWVTIDASKTLDQVTDDMQKAVHRVTSSIDRVGAKLGKLFVMERPPNVRAASSNELLPPSVIPNIKRSSMSSENSGRKRPSLDHPRITTPNGGFPASRPSGSPLTYTEQLAAVRAAAAGTLSGLLGGSSTNVDQQSPSVNEERPLPDADGPSPINATRGQGFDSARVLANRTDGSGRRRTLIDVIGELEGQAQRPPTWPEHHRSLSAAAEPTSPTLLSHTEGLPSSFAHAGRARRSTDQGPVSQPVTTGSGALTTVAHRGNTLTAQGGAANTDGAAPTAAADGEKPLASPSDLRACSFSSAGNTAGADASLVPRASTLSPTARTASPAITTSSRSSVASPPPPTSSTSPIQRPASTHLGGYSHVAASSDSNLLSSHRLSMLNSQLSQAELQEQYMRNYMAMMANPMMAQQAQYQLMLQRHQQQYYGRASSAIGGAAFNTSGNGSNLGAGANGNGVQSASGPPLAAFMQPTMGMPQSTEAISKSTNGQRKAHSRTQSSGSLYENNVHASATSASTSQPMLSMMMAPPPPTNTANTVPTAASFYPAHAQAFYAQPMFYPNGTGGQLHPLPHMMGSAAWAQQQQMAGGYTTGPTYPSTRSEIATTTVLRSQRSRDKGSRGQ